jgi:hypothetical protein
LNRTHLKGKQPTVNELLSIASEFHPTNKAIATIEQMTDCLTIPCQVLHPARDYCTINSLWVFKQTFLKIIPVYLSLNLVPAIVFKLKEFNKRYFPIDSLTHSTLLKSLKNAVRSTVFISTFCSSYQTLICLHRNIVKNGWVPFESKFLYYVAGLFSGTSILLEDQKRRPELAMYMFPKGLESFYRVLRARNWIFHVPYFEVFMFSMGTGLILAHFHQEPEALSTFMRRLLDRIQRLIEDSETPILPVNQEEM